MAVVMITGCSSGFGEAAALEFARRGHRVFATVRKQNDADALATRARAAGVALETLLLDVTDRRAITAAVGQVIAIGARIDVLVNNAGVNALGSFEDMLEADLERAMQTNFYGPVWLTRAVLPYMRAQGGGRIIMVSSLSALIGLPGDSFYCASKAALQNAAEGLRHEVSRFGIHVSVIEPGLFRTRMPEKTAAGGSFPPGSPYAPLIDFLVARSQSRLDAGDDPRRIAVLLADIAEIEHPEFRYPAGPQAEQVVAKLDSLTRQERDALIPSINDTEWWSACADTPSNRGSP
jgi:NAD(P)-dependent dehydrogenase (short-subunit alcohol dehydrogenase family)